VRSDYDGGPIEDWNEPWLIQRLQKPFGDNRDLASRIFSFGGGMRDGGLTKKATDLLQEIFTFDYMGAAEYEYGTVPKTLRSIVATIPELSTSSFEIDLGDIVVEKWEERDFKKTKKGMKKTVYLLAKKSHHEPMEKYIRTLIGKEPPRLKESAGFRNAILEPSDPKEDWRQRIQGWLDLNNCLFFFTDKDMFERTTLLFLGNLKPEIKAV
jgi:hypothetical protein